MFHETSSSITKFRVNDNYLLKIKVYLVKKKNRSNTDYRIIIDYLAHVVRLPNKSDTSSGPNSLSTLLIPIVLEG